MSNIKKLSPRELAAQIILPRFSIKDYRESPEYRKNIEELVKIGVGGFCIFGGSPPEVKHITDDLQIMAKIPLIFAADLENGLTMRFDNGTDFPHAMALGKAKNTENVRKVASIIAKEAKMSGITWNLAPVCDINSNEENPIINIRSFGENSDIVSINSRAYIEGTHSEKTISCAKHFPGHGDTDIDSHIGIPVLKGTLESIEHQEIKPFKEAISVGVRSIMIGHLKCSALEPNGKIASLSKNVVDYLLSKLDFKGLILTDALDMKSITDNYLSDQAALEAFTAGNDILLMPEDPLLAIDSLEKELKSNNNSYKLALDSAERLYKEKQWCQVTLPTIDISEKNLEHYAMEHQKIALDVAEPALKIIGNKDIIPIKDDIEIAGFSFLFGEEMEKGVLFFKMLAQAIENNVHFGFINDQISTEEILKLSEETKTANLVIFSFFVKGQAYQKKVEINDRINEIMTMLSGNKDKLVILFGNPYLSKMIRSDNILFTYSDSLPSIAAAVMKLSGRTANVS